MPYRTPPVVFFVLTTSYKVLHSLKLFSDLQQVMDLMGQAMEQFGLMMCCAEVVRKVCPSVFTVAGESITVTTMKMPQ